MIARRWRVWTSIARAEELEPYLQRTGVGDALRTPGNLGALLLRCDDGARSEFELTTLWTNVDAIRAFAGEDYERAVLYPEDAELFVAWDEMVRHAVVVTADGLLEAGT
jgi:heme-degrading monooxygenase HmoA